MNEWVTCSISVGALFLSVPGCSGGGNKTIDVGLLGSGGTLGAVAGASSASSGGAGGRNDTNKTGTAGVGGNGSSSSANGSANGGSGGSASAKADAAAPTAKPDAAISPSDAGDSGAPKPPPIACTAPKLSAGDHNMMLDHDGQQRTYTVHVPTSYDATKAVPLVLDFHGWTSNAGQEEMVSGWQQKADKVGFIAAYPEGLGNSWNGGALCCGSSQSGMVDDEGFARAIVKQIQQDACIDEKRVYVTGISNGGAMSHLLACNAADVFAASAPVAMGNGVTPCNPSRPISVVMFRAMMDILVPYDGGPPSIPVSTSSFPSAQADFDMWKSIDGCTSDPITTHTYCKTYMACKGGVEVTLCSLPNASHIVYFDTSISVADVAWEAFERQSLP